jgi:hypothetical protein
LEEIELILGRSVSERKKLLALHRDARTLLAGAGAEKQGRRADSEKDYYQIPKRKKAIAAS